MRILSGLINKVNFIKAPFEQKKHQHSVDNKVVVDALKTLDGFNFVWVCLGTFYTSFNVRKAVNLTMNISAKSYAALITCIWAQITLAFDEVVDFMETTVYQTNIDNSSWGQTGTTLVVSQKRNKEVYSLILHEIMKNGGSVYRLCQAISSKHTKRTHVTFNQNNVCSMILPFFVAPYRSERYQPVFFLLL